jgi:hypothetical protein
MFQNQSKRLSVKISNREFLISKISRTVLSVYIPMNFSVLFLFLEVIIIYRRLFFGILSVTRQLLSTSGRRDFNLIIRQTQLCVAVELSVLAMNKTKHIVWLCIRYKIA